MPRYSDGSRRRTSYRMHDSPVRAARNRLITLAGLLVLVLVMMREAGQPATWTWLYKIGDPGKVDPASSKGNPPEHNSSPRIADLSSFRSPHNDDEIALLDATSKSDEEATRRAAEHVRLNPQRLVDVQDDTYFQPSEQDAWFHVLSFLKATPQGELRNASLGEVSLLQLNRQIGSYRGKVVTIRGIVRRAQAVKAPRNNVGIEEYWQLWTFEKNGTSVPFVVYVLDVPAAFPAELEMKESVSITGVAYKRWSYPAIEGTLVAPVVLARQIDWLPATATPDKAPVSSDEIFWMMIFTAAVAIVIARWLLIWSPRLLPRRGGEIESEPKVEFDSLNPSKGGND